MTSPYKPGLRFWLPVRAAVSLATPTGPLSTVSIQTQTSYGLSGETSDARARAILLLGHSAVVSMSSKAKDKQHLLVDESFLVHRSQVVTATNLIKYLLGGLTTTLAASDDSD